MQATDMPSEYDDSDVVVAGASVLSDLLEAGKGLLVVFHAPWCGHCKTLVPALKEAATKLKEQGVTVAAVDGQMSPQVAQQLGVRGYPALKWLQVTDEALLVADHNGARTADAIVAFASAAAKASEDKAAAQSAGGEAPEEAPKEAPQAEAEPPKSKLSQSKLAGSKVGETAAAGKEAAKDGESKVGIAKAKAPEEAGAEAAPAAAAA